MKYIEGKKRLYRFRKFNIENQILLIKKYECLRIG